MERMRNATTSGTRPTIGRAPANTGQTVRTSSDGGALDVAVATMNRWLQHPAVQHEWDTYTRGNRQARYEYDRTMVKVDKQSRNIRMMMGERNDD